MYLAHCYLRWLESPSPARCAAFNAAIADCQRTAKDLHSQEPDLAEAARQLALPLALDNAGSPEQATQSVALTSKRKTSR